MPTVTQIRSGLAARLATIAGLKASSVWPDSLNLPAAIVRPQTGLYHQAMGDPGYQQLTYEIVLLVAPLQNGLAVGQSTIDPYLDASGTKSIKAAIEGDVTLGGLVSTLIVTGWRDYGTLMAASKVADIEYFGAILDVIVEC